MHDADAQADCARDRTAAGHASNNIHNIRYCMCLATASFILSRTTRKKRPCLRHYLMFV
jgi:hypothetical protein